MFEFANSSCVVVGTFNIYIIQPQWLSEVDIIPTGSKVSIQADMRSPGFKFKLPDSDDLLWNIRPDRLSVESKQFNSDCGKPIAEVLKQLPWTPVAAVGCNAIFKASRDQIGKLSLLFSDDSPPDEYAIVQKTWHREIQRDDLVFNIQVSVTNDQITLSLNAHTEAKKDRAIRETNQMVQESCASFVEQRKEAVRLAQSLLNVEIKQ